MNVQTVTRKAPNPAEMKVVSEAPAAQLPATLEAARHVPANDVPLAPIARVQGYPADMSKAVLKVIRGIGTIDKAGWNSFQKYAYQKWDDILSEVSRLTAENGLIIQQSQVSSSISNNDALLSITYSFTIIHESGEVWPERIVQTGIARLCDAKGVYDDKAANKCQTQAHKYFLIHFFKIKTGETIDADGNMNGGPASRRRAPNPATPTLDETKPHALDVKKLQTFPAFADKFIDLLKTAKTIEELSEWNKLNADSLGIVQESAPDEFERIKVAYAGHRASFKPAAAQPSTEAERSAEADAKLTANVPTEAFAFLTWAAERLAECDADTLADTYTDSIEPHVPAEVAEDVMGLYRARERELEGVPDPAAKLLAEVAAQTNVIELIRWTVAHRIPIGELPDEAKVRVETAANRKAAELKAAERK